MRKSPVPTLPREASRASGYTPSACLAGGHPLHPRSIAATLAGQSRNAPVARRVPPCGDFAPPIRVDNGRRRKTRCWPPCGPVWRSGLSAPSKPEAPAKRRNMPNYRDSIFEQDKDPVRLTPARASLHRPATPFGGYGFCHKHSGADEKLSEADENLLEEARNPSASRTSAC